MPRTLLDLQTEHCAWAAQTFPGQTTRAKIRHFKRELTELRRNPTDHMELADCLLFLLELAHDAKVSAPALIECGFAKLEINKQRRWSQPDAHGVIRHIEEAA